MNRRNFTILLVHCTLILTATGAMSQSPERGVGPHASAQLWRRYTVKGEEFSIILPTLPAMTTTEVLRKGDGKRRLERHLQTALDGVVYIVEVFENPKPRQSLEEFIAEHNWNSQYDPATERRLTINGFAGKEYLSRNKTSPTTVQFVATEERLFLFLASGPSVAGPNVKEFFSSIILGKKVDGLKVSDGPGTPLELDETIFRGKDVEVMARLLVKPEPLYTENARHNRVEGTVVLKAVFAANGHVENISVISGLPHGLTEQAIKVAKQIKFIPAMKNGKYVSMWIQLEYNFSL